MLSLHLAMIPVYQHTSHQNAASTSGLHNTICMDCILLWVDLIGGHPLCHGVLVHGGSQFTLCDLLHMLDWRLGCCFSVFLVYSMYFCPGEHTSYHQGISASQTGGRDSSGCSSEVLTRAADRLQHMLCYVVGISAKWRHRKRESEVPSPASFE